jgi:hypothetical protein
MANSRRDDDFFFRQQRQEEIEEVLLLQLAEPDIDAKDLRITSVSHLPAADDYRARHHQQTLVNQSTERTNILRGFEANSSKATADGAFSSRSVSQLLCPFSTCQITNYHHYVEYDHDRESGGPSEILSIPGLPSV